MAPLAFADGTTLDKDNLVHVCLMRAEQLRQERDNRDRAVTQAKRFADPAKSKDEYHGIVTEQLQKLAVNKWVRDEAQNAVDGNAALYDSLREELDVARDAADDPGQQRQMAYFRRNLFEFLDGTAAFHTPADVDGLHDLQRVLNMGTAQPALLQASEQFSVEELQRIMKGSARQNSWTIDQVFAQLRQWKARADSLAAMKATLDQAVQNEKQRVESRDLELAEQKVEAKRTLEEVVELRKELTTLKITSFGMVTREAFDVKVADLTRALEEQKQQSEMATAAQLDEQQSQANDAVLRVSERLEHDHQNKLDEKEAEIRALSERITELNGDVRAKAIQIEGLSATNKTLSDANTNEAANTVAMATKRQFDELQQQYNRCTGLEAELTEAAKRLEKENQARMKADDRARHAAESLERAKTEHGEALHGLQERIAHEKASHAEARAEIGSLVHLRDERVPDLVKTVETARIMIEGLRLDLKGARQEVVASNAAKDKVNERLIVAEGQLQVTKAELATNSNEVAQMKDRITQSEAQTHQLEATKAAALLEGGRWKRDALEITRHAVESLVLSGITGPNDIEQALSIILRTTRYVPRNIEYPYRLDDPRIVEWDISCCTAQEVVDIGGSPNIMTRLWLEACCLKNSANIVRYVEAVIARTAEGLVLQDDWLEKLVATATALIDTRITYQAEAVTSLALVSLRVMELLIRQDCRLGLGRMQEWYTKIKNKTTGTDINDPLVTGLFDWVYATLFEPAKLRSLPSILWGYDGFELITQFDHDVAGLDRSTFQRRMLSGAKTVIVVDGHSKHITAYAYRDINYRFVVFPACFYHLYFGVVRRMPFSTTEYREPDFRTHDKRGIFRWVTAHKPEECAWPPPPRRG